MLLGLMLLSFNQMVGLLTFLFVFYTWKLASFAKSDPDKAITWAKFLGGFLSKRR